jgi:hypothetical protein
MGKGSYRRPGENAELFRKNFPFPEKRPGASQKPDLEGPAPGTPGPPPERQDGPVPAQPHRFKTDPDAWELGTEDFI